LICMWQMDLTVVSSSPSVGDFSFQSKDGTVNCWSKCLLFLLNKNLYSIDQFCSCTVLTEGWK
jgi:hypothetical protein